MRIYLYHLSSHYILALLLPLCFFILFGFFFLSFLFVFLFYIFFIHFFLFSFFFLFFVFLFFLFSTFWGFFSYLFITCFACVYVWRLLLSVWHSSLTFLASHQKAAVSKLERTFMSAERRTQAMSVSHVDERRPVVFYFLGGGSLWETVRRLVADIKLMLTLHVMCRPVSLVLHFPLIIVPCKVRLLISRHLCFRYLPFFFLKN